MILKEWLFKNNMTYSQMAKNIQMSASYLRHIANNLGPRPSIRVAALIEHYTKGQVTMEEVRYPEKHNLEKYKRRKDETERQNIKPND